MSKTMKMIKTWLALMSVKPTNRNARKTLHRLRKLERVLKAEIKRTGSVPLLYRLSVNTKEEIDG